MSYYVDPGTTKGCAVAETWDGAIGALAIMHGPEITKRWGPFNVDPGPVYWEKPQLYPNEIQNSTPQKLIALANDLIDLSDAGKDTARALAGPHPCIAKRPREWKKQIPKPIHHARVLGRLNAQEYALLVEAYGKKDPQALASYVRAACIAQGSNKKPTYSAEITDLLDACAFALTIEGRL